MNRPWVKRVFVLLLAGFVLLLRQGPANAQDLEKLRRIEEEKRRRVDAAESQVLAEEGRLLLEWGGWLDTRYDQYNEDDNDRSRSDALESTVSFDTRIWLQLTLNPAEDDPDSRRHSFYARFKNLSIFTAPTDVNEQYDNDGPHLDQGYAVLDFRPWGLEFGRRYFSVGQGIAYSNVHDGAEIYATFTDWNFKGFYSQAIPHEPNLDLSVPGGAKDSDRYFLGLEGRYLALAGQSIYGFFVKQRDNSDEDPIDTRDYTYNSQYIGLGLQGQLPAQTHYWIEVIRQDGTSRVFSSGEKRDIDAWAADVGITRDWDIYSHPNVTLEYAFGSGDPDRSSVTDTQSGNITGDDMNFLYFGYLPTGYALAPRLSNLHMIKAGVLMKPLENSRRFRNLTLGLEYYHFRKDREGGGISDLEATVSESHIGDEIDVNMSWQFLSDATLTIQYGYFFPGAAFPDATNDSESYFSTDLTLTF